MPKLFILPASGPDPNSRPVYLSNNLLNSFEPGDIRRSEWVDSVISGHITYYYPFKYKVNKAGAAVSEYLMMLRLGEQYLIRAEARAQQGKTADALSDINTIRSAQSLSPWQIYLKVV